MTTATKSRICPVCASPLTVVLHEGVQLDRCDAGHGVWLDRGELRAVVASELADRPEAEEVAAAAFGARDGGAALVAEASAERRPCPCCGERMRLVEYANSGVPIDECHEHGAWLDAGELERIEAYAEGIRRQTASGAAGASRAGVTVAGIDVPAELLRTIRTAALPPQRG